ncbi:tetratricopeptide repeat protein [Mesobacterium pallidum]|uniref:tetratricopeptide repeat protein n=1 Tax=Mesobacterium pallidum TaxID=2872037 RepID=UPI001EE22B99|nr:tetratricopeptide repeat protein [Mesobacterium pallidum]
MAEDQAPKRVHGPELEARLAASREGEGAGAARALALQVLDGAERAFDKAMVLRDVQQVLGVEVALDMVRHQLTILQANPRLLLEQARLLTASGRSGRAEQILQDLLTPPFEAVLQMAAIQLQKGDPEAALDLLARFEEITRDRPHRYVLGGQAALKLGRAEAALDWADRGLALAPRHAPLQVLRWDALSRLRRFDAAIEACRAVIADAPDDAIEMHKKAVRFLNRIERFDIARDILLKASATQQGNADLVLLAGEVAMAEGDARGAAELLGDFAETRRVDSLFLRTRAAAMTAMGDLGGAIAVLEAGFAETDSDIRLQLAQLWIQLGEFPKARALLDGLPNDNTTHRARVAKLRGELAFARADMGVALKHQVRAIALDPYPAQYWDLRGRYALALGQVDGAWDDHLEWTRLLTDKDPTGQVTGKAMHSNTGQVLNEFRLLTTETDRAMLAAEADPVAGMRHFRARVTDEPGNTPCAMALFNLMRRAGGVTRMPPKDAGGADPGPIPRRIVQFWDSPEVPDQVEALAAETRALNPGYDFRRYDERTAAAYLHDKGEEAALVAYQLSPHAAAKSDILRLAVLYHDGGVYMDADDRCLVPLDEILPNGTRIVAYQEDLISVGNNFLAAAPGDPVFRAALDDAAIAFTEMAGESIWLATGPGAVTRAMALHGTDESGALRPDIWLMPWFRLRHFVSFHIRLSYKTSNDHWYRSMMRRR